MPKKPAKSRLRPGVKIRETLEGPTYHTVVNLGNDPRTGKRVQKRLTAPSPEELDELIVKARKAYRGHALDVMDENLLLKDFIEEWIDSTRATVKGGTILAWRTRCDVWIIPQLGGRKIRSLAPVDVDRLMKHILASGRSPSHANAVHSTLRSALKHAVLWGIIPSNPCGVVKAPRLQSPEMHVWSPEEAARAISASAEDALYGALWRLALTTGMRRGELLGLRWQDVDLDRGTIAVRQTLGVTESGAFAFSTPKTARSRRSIAIGAADVMALRHHRTIQLARRLATKRWTDHDLVFPWEHGGPTHPSVLSKAFTALIESAALPTIRIHDLRHTAATLMLASGEHPKIVSERLGHSSIAITLDLYSHVSMTMQRDAADRLEILLKRASSGSS